MENYSYKKSRQLTSLIRKANNKNDKEYFIEKKFNKIEKLLQKGAFPLMQTCTKVEREGINIGDPEMEEFILDFADEFSSLTWAIEHNKTKLSELFLNHITPRELDMNGRLDYTNKSPYEIAIKNDNVNALKLFEKYGHNLNNIDLHLDGAKEMNGKYFYHSQYTNMYKSVETSPLFVAAFYDAKKVAEHMCKNPEKYNLEKPTKEQEEKINKARDFNVKEIEDKMEAYYNEFKTSTTFKEPLKQNTKTVALQNDAELSMN